MRPPEFGSLPSNEMGFPRKNAARRARGISFGGNPSQQSGHTKIGGLHIRVLPKKLYPCAQRRDFLDAQCGSTELLKKSLVPRSPAKRNRNPISPTGEAMRFADAKRASASFLQNARRGRIQFIPKKNGTVPKKCALRAAFLSVAVPCCSILIYKNRGFPYMVSPDFCSSLRSI